MKKVCICCRESSPESAEGTAERMAKQIERCRNVDDLHNFNAVDEMMWKMKGGGVLWTDV